MLVVFILKLSVVTPTIVDVIIAYFIVPIISFKARMVIFKIIINVEAVSVANVFITAIVVIDVK